MPESTIRFASAACSFSSGAQLAPNAPVPPLQVFAEPELKVHQPTADLSNSDTVKYRDIFRGGDWLIRQRFE